MGDVNAELQKAFSTSDIPTIIQILTHTCLDVNIRDRNNSFLTPLMRTCYLDVPPKTCIDITSLILSQNADVNVQDAEGRTALIHACIAQNRDMLELLANVKDCDPNIRDHNGKRAIQFIPKTGGDGIMSTYRDCFESKR